MISVSGVSMRYGSKTLFEDVTTTFSAGRRYGLTGPNGAGKSTFMKLLTGELDPQQGTVVRPKKLGVLRQDQYAFDTYRVIDTVIMGNRRLWEALLDRLGGAADPQFVDWLAVDRSDAREFDIGIHRHWLDPMKPFARVVLEPAHGVTLTSATLKDGSEWDAAVARSGAPHIDVAPRIAAFDSPFDYASQAEVLIVTDVPKGDLAALAGAYGRLIEASGGGALGLFTAIRRLRAVHGRIADRLARAGLPLYAQHVDPIDTGTLVDIFRDDPRASLLGTDALRDGVDVPGHSLRVVVMEQAPWPKPSILHRARRLAGGGSSYDDGIIRARLAQAFGRLIRSKEDRGHFVVLSAAFPSRLLSAFPAGTPITRLTLDEALQRVAAGVSGQVPAHAASQEDDR